MNPEQPQKGRVATDAEWQEWSDIKFPEKKKPDDSFSQKKQLWRHLEGSFRWHFEKAQEGDRRAQYEVGQAFLNGRGTYQSEAEARIWFQRASDQGLAKATQKLFELDSRL